MWNAQPSDYGNYGGMGGGNNYSSSGGGGFMNSSVAGGAAAGSSKTRSTRIGSVFPCTCADILSSEQGKENFILKCGAEVNMVSVVGIIRSVNESNLRVDYEISDYTGPILKIKTFQDDDAGSASVAAKKVLPVRTYVRVFGPIRTVGGERALAGFKVKKLTNLNELTVHLLQVIKAKALHAKKEKSGSGGAAGAADFGGGFSGSVGGGGGGFNEASGLNNLQQQIQGLVRSYKGQEGISVRQICENLRGVPEKKIRESLDFLSSEGHVYSTIDDDHFCATE